MNLFLLHRLEDIATGYGTLRQEEIPTRNVIPSMGGGKVL